VSVFSLDVRQPQTLGPFQMMPAGNTGFPIVVTTLTSATIDLLRRQT
jgi:hypothetical protein